MGLRPAQVPDHTDRRPNDAFKCFAIDTSSNVLFGGLQKISAEQLRLSPVPMASANSSDGVMGKMIDAQSIVVASTATKWYGRESSILRFVFFHSLALAVLVGVLVYCQAYVHGARGQVS